MATDSMVARSKRPARLAQYMLYCCMSGWLLLGSAFADSCNTVAR
jgi:hypothetical protein